MSESKATKRVLAVLENERKRLEKAYSKARAEVSEREKATDKIFKIRQGLDQALEGKTLNQRIAVLQKHESEMTALSKILSKDYLKLLNKESDARDLLYEFGNKLAVISRLIETGRIY